MNYLIALCGLLGLGFVYNYFKRKSAEAINQNIEVKNELNKIDQGAVKAQGQLDAEEEKRKQIEEDIKNKKASTNDIQDMLDYLNKK